MQQDAISSRRSLSEAPRERKIKTKNQPGTFAGWISEEWGVAWVISPHRTDRRTGWVKRFTEPEPPQPKKRGRKKGGAL